MRYLLILVAIIVSIPVSAQKKKVIYQDTVGNTIGLIDYLAILNMGRYRSKLDEGDTKIRVVKYIPTTKHEYDSLTNLTREKTVKKEKINQPIVPFAVKDITGKEFNSSTLSGKVIVVNYWFVGCPPCEIETPELIQVYEKYKNHPDVVFLSFSRSSLGKTKRFLEKKPLPYPVVILEDELADKVRIGSFPTNQVIDKQGRYHFYSSGIGRGGVRLINEAIQSALNQTNP